MWRARSLGGVDESALGLHHPLDHVGDHQNAIDATVPLDQALLRSTCEIPTDEINPKRFYFAPGPKVKVKTPFILTGAPLKIVGLKTHLRAASTAALRSAK